MHPTYDDPHDDPHDAACGAVVEVGRGSLPFALIHGEALVACAAWALGEAGVQALDLGTPWDAVVEAGVPLVLHDPLCPMTPATFLRDCVSAAREAVGEQVVVGVGPGDPGDPVDPVPWSPVVLSAALVAGLDELPAVDFAELVTVLGRRCEVRTIVAPPAGRRVATVEDVRALERDTLPIPGVR